MATIQFSEYLVETTYQSLIYTLQIFHSGSYIMSYNQGLIPVTELPNRNTIEQTYRNCLVSSNMALARKYLFEDRFVCVSEYDVRCG